MKTLFFIGMISWIIHTLATGASIILYNYVKPYLLNDPANLPAWYKTIIWILNLSALSYWISTILIFFSFQSPAFMIMAILMIVGLIALTKYRGKNKISQQATEEEIQNFKLGFKGIITAWCLAMVVFLIGASPYLIYLLFALL